MKNYKKYEKFRHRFVLRSSTAENGLTLVKKIE